MVGYYCGSVKIIKETFKENIANSISQLICDCLEFESSKRPDFNQIVEWLRDLSNEPKI